MTSDNDPMQQALPLASDPFDVDAFMQQSVEGIGSTQVTPIPAGSYIALIGSETRDVVVKTFTNKTTNEVGAQALVTFRLIDDSGQLKAKLGREPRHTQGYFLDTVNTPTGRALDMGEGKNVQLNRLRAAVGQNTGQASSLPMLRGAGPLRIELVIEPDRVDKETPRNRIKAVGTV